MNYAIKAESTSGSDGDLDIKDSVIVFGTGEKTSEQLPNPAELFLGSFAACILKNVERFSKLLHYTYSRASIKVNAVRLESPPAMDKVNYELTVFSNDIRFKPELLKKNIEKFGTIYNTVNKSCSISGTINKRKE